MDKDCEYRVPLTLIIKEAEDFADALDQAAAVVTRVEIDGAELQLGLMLDAVNQAHKDSKPPKKQTSSKVRLWPIRW